MENSIQKPFPHHLNTVMLSLSVLFERMGYYGVRGILVLYMMKGALHFSKEETATIYGFFTLAIYLVKIPGGILGDFVLGRKGCMIIGGLLQAVGAFLLCLPFHAGFFAGLLLILLGGGLYSPNALAQMATGYLGKKRYMDAAFTIFYVAINIGAFIAPILCGYFGDTGNPSDFKWGFMIAGGASLLAVLMSVISKDEPLRQMPTTAASFHPRDLLYLLPAVILPIFFWTAYEWMSMGTSDIMVNAETYFGNWKLPWSYLQATPAFTLFIVLPLLAILWSFVNIHSYLKIIIGLTLCVLAALGLMAISSTLGSGEYKTSVTPLLAQLFLVGVAESFVAPIFMSLVGKHAPLRLMATLMGVFGMLTFIANKTSSSLPASLSESPAQMGLAAAILFAITLVLVAVLYAVHKLTSRKEVNFPS
jgi:POT family proton-dependent oligopeptide transporter